MSITQHREKLKVAIDEISEDGPELLRYKEARKLLGKALGKTDKEPDETGKKPHRVSHSYIRKLCNQGKLIRKRVGLRACDFRITRASVLAFLEERENELATVEEMMDGKMQRWRALKQVKAREDAMGKLPEAETVSLEGATVIPDSQTYQISDLGTFARPFENYNYEDPLTHRVVPYNCYLDEEENLVCGILEPPYDALMFLRRKKRLGLNGSPKALALNVSESRKKIEKLSHAESEAIYKASYYPKPEYKKFS